MTFSGLAWAGRLRVTTLYQASTRVPGTMSAALTVSFSQPGAAR